MDSDPPAGEPTDSTESPLPHRLYAATLRCENCDADTPHRVLRMAHGIAPRSRVLSGTARCRRCGLTHTFTVASPPEVEVAVVVSEGPRSDHHRIRIPSLGRVELGALLPGAEGPVLVRRIETRSRLSVSSARPEEISTIWAARDLGAVIPVSVVEGARTWTDHLTLPRESRLSVGDPIMVRDTSVRIVALRARGRTWRRPEDAFAAQEVQRIYTRRTEIPPAGRRPWSNGRVRPSSRASSFSSSSRSRSGPGVSRTRKTPRARIASGGATHQSVSPS